MAKKISALLAAMLFIASTLPASSYGFDLFPKLEHTIIIAGVVKCVENGVERPEAGATVTVNMITDMEDGEYTPSKPQTATTDENGLWVMVFSIPMNSIIYPDRFYGEITPRCKTGKVEIKGDFEMVHNLSGFFNMMTGRAGNLADLIKNIVTKLLKIKLPGPPASIKLVAHAAYHEITITCGKEAPPGEKEEDTSVQPKGPERPQEQPEDVTPKTPERDVQTEEPRTPPDIVKGTPKKPAADEYGKCIEKCKPYLDKLERLKKKLKELNESESDEEKKWRAELERLKDVLAKNLSRKQIKYITPDGGEHWGSPDFVTQYKLNGYTPVPGTERISPERQRFIDMIRRKIADAEKRLNDAIAKDWRNKEAARKKLKDEMDKVLKEYENCVRSCDTFKLPGDRRSWRDFMPKSPYSDFDYNPKGDYFKPVDDTGARTPPDVTPKGPAGGDAVPTPPKRPGPGPRGWFGRPRGGDSAPLFPIPGSPKEDAGPRPAPQTPPPAPAPAGPTDATGGPGDTARGPQDAPAGGGTVTDAGPGAMPISDPVPLPASPEDGFTKVPELDLSKYSTTVMKPGTEDIQYRTLKDGDVTCDTAVSYKKTPDGMEVSTASVATGKGANFRRWEVDDVRLNVDGEIVKPSNEEPIHIEKDSYFRAPAVATFVALGSQYRGPAEKCGSGEVCPVTGQPKEKKYRDSAIDKAGMAAGLGLLASQAKGEITGRKASFRLDNEQADKVMDKKAALKVNAKNEEAHQNKTFNLPLR